MWEYWSRLSRDQDSHTRSGQCSALRATEPVSWVPVLGGWMVTGRDLVVQVLCDPARFTVDDPRFLTHQVLGPSMLSLDGGEHLRHRDPFEHAFRHGDPGVLRERMVSTAASLLTGLFDCKRAIFAHSWRRPWQLQ